MPQRRLIEEGGGGRDHTADSKPGCRRSGRSDTARGSAVRRGHDVRPAFDGTALTNAMRWCDPKHEPERTCRRALTATQAELTGRAGAPMAAVAASLADRLALACAAISAKPLSKDGSDVALLACGATWCFLAYNVAAHVGGPAPPASTWLEAAHGYWRTWTAAVLSRPTAEAAAQVSSAWPDLGARPLGAPSSGVTCTHLTLGHGLARVQPRHDGAAVLFLDHLGLHGTEWARLELLDAAARIAASPKLGISGTCRWRRTRYGCTLRAMSRRS